jgi:hypothetical protein
MVVIRDEKRIARMQRISRYTSLLGIAALIGGLVIAFTNPERFFVYELLALAAGWLLSQVGIYLGQRYVRDPRPDEVLDKAVKPAAKNGRMYHYVISAPHVLLMPEGIIVFNPKFQRGDISVTGTEKGDKWKQRGVGLRRFFGGEGLGNPTKEVQSMVGAVANHLKKHAPEVEEVPIAPIVVFTEKGTQELTIDNPSVPVIHYEKLRGFLRQQWKRAEDKPKMDRADYEAIRAAFDREAGDVLPQEEGEEA